MNEQANSTSLEEILLKKYLDQSNCLFFLVPVLDYVRACNAGDVGLILGSGRSPGEENGYMATYSTIPISTVRETLPEPKKWAQLKKNRGGVQNLERSETVLYRQLDDRGDT